MINNGIIISSCEPTAPPLKHRTWKLPDVPHLAVVPKDLPSLMVVAEVTNVFLGVIKRFRLFSSEVLNSDLLQMLHILRPLTHLAGMTVWGPRSWKPWLLSIVMDVTSLQIHKQMLRRLRPEQKQELSRRTFALLYYLMRSPFYDTYTKKRLMGFLYVMSKRVPLIGRLFAVLAESIPDWQQTYSYIWNDF